MIDTSAWKEFRVGDYFHGVRGTSRKMQELNEGKTPVIAAARYNQGIAGYYDVPSEYENAITISCNGVGCGSTYYHDYPFAITGDAIVLENIGNVPIGALHFIASVYDVYFSRKYSYTDKCSADKAEAECISLPATSDGQPDWDYMESYMKAVMEESEKSLENLRKTDDTKCLIDTSNWKKFKVSDIFVTEKHGSGLQVPTGAMMSKKDLVDGDIPRVTVSNFNNGITGYYAASDDKNYRTYQNFISVSFLGTVFYQPDEVSLDMKVHCLKPLDYKLNIYSAGYIVSIIRKAISNFAYSDQLSSTVLAELKFALPSTSDGRPDWQYMEDYMRRIMDKSEQIISDLQIGA